MPKVFDLASELAPDELERYHNSPRYRAMIGRDRGDWKRGQRSFLRVILGVKWRWRCAYCRVAIFEDDDPVDIWRRYLPSLEFRSWSDDHILPQRNSGEYRANNIVPACVECNTGRMHVLIDEYLTSRGWNHGAIQKWHAHRLFDLGTARLIDRCLDQIKAGRVFTVADVPWMQFIGARDGIWQLPVMSAPTKTLVRHHHDWGSAYESRINQRKVHAEVLA